MRTLTTITLLLALALMATTAQANVYSFNDNAIYYPGWQNHTSDDYNDVIGLPNFLGGEVSYTAAGGGNYFLNSVTFFMTADSSLYNLLDSGDLFLNVNGDTTWDFGVALNQATSTTVNVYSFDADYNDSSSYIMSSLPGYQIRENHPIAGVYDDPADLFGTAQSDGLPALDTNNVMTVTVSGLNIAFTNLLLGYTVSCANDVIYAGVQATPIPGAIWLLGAGLMGLVGIRRARNLG